MARSDVLVSTDWAESNLDAPNTVFVEVDEDTSAYEGGHIAGAVRLARALGPGKTIVTVLCDYGNRYQSKLFNPEFLRSKGLPVPHWLEPRQPTDWHAVVEPEPVA